MQRITATMTKEFSKKHDVHLLLTSGKKDGNLYNMPDAQKITVYELSIPRKIIRNTLNILAKKGFFNAKRVEKYGSLMFLKKQRNFLVDFINDNQFDLVVGFDTGSDLWMASVKERVKTPMVGVIQASYDHFFGSSDRGNYKHEFIFQHYLKKLDNLIVLSDDDKKTFFNKLGLEAVRVYNAHDMEYDEISTLSNKKFIALGRCAHHKGFDVLLEGFKIFALTNKEWTLDIVGDGPLKPFLEQKIDEFNLRDRVKLFPYTSNVKKHLAQASVFVFCSRSEGFGIVQIEAMSCGLPIVASTIPVTQEILTSQKVAIFYETENPYSLAKSLHEIITSDLKKMSKNAIQYSKSFTAEEIGKQYEEIFNEAVGCVPVYNI
ncbi:glycosyltransferase [Litoribacter populi]|uniref:glycosyltransferase n=1 Tax=Litoribacter populi TaxID=2598460 RepID=UPI001C8F2649|nr:glycosyltransferase [Litoribacter populi]